MPEVIEIKKYADFLKKHLKNKNIEEFNIKKGRYKKHGPFNLYDTLRENIPIKVIDIKTKGKFLYIILDKNFYIFSTLGLTGGWVFYKNSNNSINLTLNNKILLKENRFKFPKMIDYIQNNKLKQYKKIALNNLNIEIKINNGSIYYYDSLSFGTMKIINTKEELDSKLKTIGPDIMDLETTYYIFKEQLMKKIYQEKVIGIVLMNQKIISGIGNYLRSDILWLSKISPYRKVKDLSEDELKLLYKNTRLLTWGDYNYKEALKLKIITKKDKLPKDYERNFFVYKMDYDIYGNKIIKEPLYTGKEKRFIYWIPSIQI
jgi:formamidopyrimidine-DNA glycosylase